jgi:hypothetical protein
LGNLIAPWRILGMSKDADHALDILIAPWRILGMSKDAKLSERHVEISVDLW